LRRVKVAPSFSAEDEPLTAYEEGSMEEVMTEEAYGREDAPQELRVPPVQRALRVARPVGDALAKSGRDAADVLQRQSRSFGRYSAEQMKARPLTAAAVALAAGAVLGALLSPRRRAS
jgi:ElaB/YqjD/DUF883 family membrane-anchored ribosome-binding protein